MAEKKENTEKPTFSETMNCGGSRIVGEPPKKDEKKKWQKYKPSDKKPDT